MADPRPPILVVDAEAAVGGAVRAALGPDYVVRTAASGKQACTILRRHRVAAIILEPVLPGEDGLDRVGTFRRLSGAPILILTGHSTEALAIRAIRARVDGYLKKPGDLRVLPAALEHLLAPRGWLADPAVRARRYLDEHLGKPIWTRVLARQLGLSEGHLRRLFRHTYGQTPRQYLAAARLRQAQDLVGSTRRRMARIARDLGWRSVSTFSRDFRRFSGMSPSRWRAEFSAQTDRGRKGGVQT